LEETNNAGYGWMVFQGLVRLTDGKEVEIYTNEKWKEESTFHQGWETTDFDDRSWKTPVEADKKVADFNFMRMRRPNKILFSKSTVWWRIDNVPNAKYLVLHGLGNDAVVWLDGKKTEAVNGRIDLPEGTKLITVMNGEDASGLSAPGTFHCEGKSKTNLRSWLDMGLRRFTGFIDYETMFDVPEDASSAVIDLGDVRYMAEVWVNGEKIGERLWPPFVFKAGNLKKGKNSLRVRVGNLMVNQMGGMDDLGKLRTWGWQMPEPGSFNAGLLGPVRVKFYR